MEVQAGNMRAAQALYAMQALETLRVFDVVDRIGERFAQGLLPLDRGAASERLADRLRRAAEGPDGHERRALCAHVFGGPAGTEGETPNREFDSLWMRFVAAVSEFAARPQAERLSQNAALQDGLREAGRALAIHLSMRAGGVSPQAIGRLQGHALECRDVLADAALQGAFGARGLWQVVSEVVRNDLGERDGIAAALTRAKAGGVVMRWLSDNADRLAPRKADVLRLSPRWRPATRARPCDPTRRATDAELVEACHQWLAANSEERTAASPTAGT